MPKGENPYLDEFGIMPLAEMRRIILDRIAANKLVIPAMPISPLMNRLTSIM
jgi:hypothetical protein